MASRGFILMIICKDTKPEKRTRSIRRRIMVWNLRIIRAHTCVFVYVRIFGYEQYISTGVFSKIFIAFLTGMFSKIICKNYTHDTKIINYIVYSKMYGYILMIVWYVFVCVCSVFFFIFIIIIKHVFR